MDGYIIDDGGDSEEDESRTSDDEGIEAEFKSRVDAIIRGVSEPYDHMNESAPNLAAYHPSFNRAEALCGEVTADAAALLKASAYRDNMVTALLERIEEHHKVKYSEAKKVGIVGNLGVGKSSLINAVLDTPDLAPNVCSSS